jgi:hypothetical protein
VARHARTAVVSGASVICIRKSTECGGAGLTVRLRETRRLSLGPDALEEPMVNVESFVYHVLGSPSLAVRVAPFRGVWAIRMQGGVPQPLLVQELDPALRQRLTLVAGAVRDAVAVAASF